MRIDLIKTNVQFKFYRTTGTALVTNAFPVRKKGSIAVPASVDCRKKERKSG
jgi:hypothetical protein